MDSIMYADEDANKNLDKAARALLEAMWREHPHIMRQRTGKALLDARYL